MAGTRSKVVWRRKSIALVLLVLLQLQHKWRAEAWDSDGHQAVGMTAMSVLKNKANSQIKRLMGGKDVVDVAGWAHRVEEKYPALSSLHFQVQPKKFECTYVDLTICDEGRCLVRALQHFYGRLTGRPDLVPFKYPNNIQLTDSDAIKYLVNLIGDLHQPMHVGFKVDDCGRNLNGTFADNGRARPTTLFKFWDTDLIQKFIRDRPSYWYSGWTHAHTLGRGFFELQKSLWENEPSDKRHLLFEKWASETLLTTCGKAYKNAQTGEMFDQGFQLPDALEFLVLEEVKRQILVAGVRIAVVLNSILEDRDAIKLRQGSGVEVPLDDDRGTSAGGKSTLWLKNLSVNLIILVVVLGVFFYVTKFYSPSVQATQRAGGGNFGKEMEKRS